MHPINGVKHLQSQIFACFEGLLQHIFVLLDVLTSLLAEVGWKNTDEHFFVGTAFVCWSLVESFCL